MKSIKQTSLSEFGHNLVDSLSIPEKTLNTLFSALFLTSVFVFLGGNLLLLDAAVLQRSAQIALPCFGMLLIFYTISRFLGSVIWGLVLTYGLMWIATYSRQINLIPVVYVSASICFVYAIRFMRVDSAQWISLLLMAVIASATILGTGRAYTSFDMLERLYAGNVNQDTLYHASIAAMIKNYGIVSTGLHGLVETPYHVFSHVLFSSISLLSGLGVIDVYGVANWVLFAPILIFSVVAFCAMLDNTEEFNIPLAWGLVCLVLMAAPFLFGRWALWDSFFVSESYLVSLGLFMMGLAMLFNDRLSLVDLLLVVVLTAMISNAKASVGLIFAGLWIARVLFVRGERLIFDVAAFLLSMAAVCFVVFNSAKSSSGSITFVPLSFIGVYSFLGGYIVETGSALLGKGVLSFKSVLLGLASIISFFIFHFILSWVGIVKLAITKGSLLFLKVPVAVYSLTAVLFGFVIISCFSIPGGSAGYFSNVAFFVSLPWVVAISSHWLELNKLMVKPVVIFGILIVFMLGARGFYNASIFSRPTIKPNSTFIDSLKELRYSNAKNVVMQLDTSEPIKNPIKRDTAKPFVFPAISERPWIGVIREGSDCIYRDYGYSQYGFTKSQQHLNVQPRILAGMQILIWPIQKSNL